MNFRFLPLIITIVINMLCIQNTIPSVEFYLVWEKIPTLNSPGLKILYFDKRGKLNKQINFSLNLRSVPIHVVKNNTGNYLSVISLIDFDGTGRFSAYDYKFVDLKTHKVLEPIFPKIKPVLSNWKNFNENYSWSVNGRYFAFRGIAQERTQVERYIYDTLTNQILELEFIDGNVDRIYWSSDSQFLVSQSISNGQTLITLTNIITKKIEKTINVTQILSSEPDNRVCQLVLSPDNRFLAFISECSSGPLELPHEIFVADLVTNNIHQATFFTVQALKNPNHVIAGKYNMYWEKENKLVFSSSLGLIANEPVVNFSGYYMASTMEVKFLEENQKLYTIFNPNINQTEFVNDCNQEWSQSGDVKVTPTYSAPHCRGTVVNLEFEDRADQTINRTPLNSSNSHFYLIGWVIK
jgi:hypothetical protein